MRPLSSSLFAASLAFAAATACTSVPALPLPGAEAPAVTLQREVALPPEVAAFLCAAACRRALPSSESLARQGGAPVRRTGPGAYEVCYQQSPTGRWSCDANGRLLPEQVHEPSRPFAASFEAAAAAPGRDPSASPRLRIRIRPSPAGSRIQGELRLLAADSLAHDIGAMLDLALAERQGARLLQQQRFDAVIANAGATAASSAVGCSEPAPLLARCLLQQAVAHDQRGELRLAYRALRSARMADRELRGFELWSARLAESLGLDDAARADYRMAAITSTDAAVRCGANAGLARLQLRQRQPGTAFAADAARQLDAGKLTSARSLLDRARAEAPDPARDLQLLRELQLARGDARAALATAMLLREYAPSALAEQFVYEGLRAVGAETLAARSRGRIQDLPLLASPQR